MLGNALLPKHFPNSSNQRRIQYIHFPHRLCSFLPQTTELLQQRIYHSSISARRFHKFVSELFYHPTLLHHQPLQKTMKMFSSIRFGNLFSLFDKLHLNAYSGQPSFGPSIDDIIEDTPSGILRARKPKVSRTLSNHRSPIINFKILLSVQQLSIEFIVLTFTKRQLLVFCRVRELTRSFGPHRCHQNHPLVKISTTEFLEHVEILDDRPCHAGIGDAMQVDDPSNFSIPFRTFEQLTKALFFSQRWMNAPTAF